MSVSELQRYLEEQQTDISDLADILYELPKRIASEMVTALVDRDMPFSSSTYQPTTGNAPQASTPESPYLGDLVFVLKNLDKTLARQTVLAELEQLR